ncbi:hypothetical protein [Coleofasciculus sp. FACHB-129]|uniref:hypothetical protein n=1 Tax=Coleofasciculus sp. FACHB-129 TaxID=2692785 RepID=UPI001A7E216B|nr:hypothetical protein [Coleofasciculus sp. FACHB-129]
MIKVVVFFQENGKPFTSETFCGLFKQVAYCLTGKACNPQLIRDMAIAHLMSSRTSSADSRGTS